MKQFRQQLSRCRRDDPPITHYTTAFSFSTSEAGDTSQPYLQPDHESQQQLIPTWFTTRRTLIDEYNASAWPYQEILTLYA